MQEIRRSEIPSYLHRSELYLSFSDDCDDEISVPRNCLKMNTTVKSSSDLEHLLSTVRYWILSPFPSELIAYIVDLKNKEVPEVLKDYELAFPNVLKLVRDLRQPRGKKACTLAAKHGCVDFLDYFVNRKELMDTLVLVTAAMNGHVNCLVYSHNHLRSLGRLIDFSRMDWVPVVQRGHLECLQYIMIQIKGPNDRWFCEAAKCGQLSCLQFLFTLSDKCESVRSITEAAARANQLSCLQYTVEQDCRVSFRAWEGAIFHASTKDAKCLEYLLDTVPLPKNLMILGHCAIRLTNFSALGILHQRGHLIAEKCVVAAAKAGSLLMLMYCHHELHYNCWVPSTMAAAAKAGQLELVKQLHAQGCPWDETAPAAALRANQPDCLRFLIEQRGIPTSKSFSSINASLYCRILMLEQQLAENNVKLDRVARSK